MIKFKVEKGKNIRLDLIQQKKDVEFVCNGNGTCGKCLIKVIKGHLEINESDQLFLSNEQLESGLRLACKHHTTEDIECLWLQDSNRATIESKTIGNIKNEFQVDTIADGYILKHQDKIVFQNIRNCFLGIAIDIGTTTVVLQLIDLVENHLISERKILNSQKVYGADVITRINHATMGGLKDLHDAIINDLEKSITEMFSEHLLEFDDLVRISISGNNVMNHLFLNVNPKSLGKLPFEPVFINPICIPSNQIFSFKSNAQIHVMGSFSGFVGADIVSGVLSLGELTEEWFLLLDLGTNGEMVLGNKNVLYVTSTAVGPALEGGNISCGMGSVDGAINIVKIIDEKIEIKTINQSLPKGICGSGIIDLVSELVKSKKVNPSGKMIDLKKIDLTTQIAFTQKDIRQVQFAKSAVRSGIEMLVQIADIPYHDIKKVYLSGGLGNNANLESVINIGMIPSILKDRVNPSGNTSLSGAIYNLFSLEEATEKTLKYQKISKTINLAEYKRFNDLFIENCDLDD